MLTFPDKEQWEPVIENLFNPQQKMGKAHRIREAWSFDWQSHGDAAILNRQLLKVRPGGVCMSNASFFFSLRTTKSSSAIHDWRHAIANFVRSPYMKGHRIVPLGHSAGAAATSVVFFF